MSDPLSIVSGIAGIISLSIEIIKISHAYASGVSGASKSIKSLVQELLKLKNILSDVQDNILLNPEVAEAFGPQHSSVLHRTEETVNDDKTLLSESAEVKGDLSLLDQCAQDLQELLNALKAKSGHGRFGTAVARLTWPLTEPEMRKKLDLVHRYQSLLQTSINIDTLALVAQTHNRVIEIGEEQISRERKKKILHWLSPLDFSQKQNDANSRRHPETAQWLLESEEFRNWLQCPLNQAQRDGLTDVLFEETAQPISQEQPPAGCRRMKNSEFTLYCDRCPNEIKSAEAVYYHCCDCDDNFDLCVDCVTKGCVGVNPDHTLYLITPKKHANTLWCPGEPGAGKTIAASMVVKYLAAKAKVRHWGFAYLYIYYDDQTNQSPSRLLGSLAKQLVEQCQPFPLSLERFYNQNSPGPDVDDCLQILESLLPFFEQTFLVIDALDESDNDTQKHRKPLLAALTKLMKVDVNIFATSRTTFEDINATFTQALQVPISAKADDLRVFLESKIEENDDLQELIADDYELKEKIIVTIISKADGQFLLPSLHIERLGEYTCREEIEEALEDMTGSIYKTYETTLQRFQRHSPARQSLAFDILMWLAHAKRPLLFEQLREALAVKPGTTTLNRKSFRTKRVMLDVCLGLVVVEDVGTVIRLVHFTLQEYLANYWKLRQNAETLMATICLTCLLFEGVPVAAHSESPPHAFILRGPFFTYAMQHWSDHARLADMEQLQQLILRYFTKKPRCIPAFPGLVYIEQKLPTPDALGYAGIFFLPALARSLLAQGEDMHAAKRVASLVYWATRSRSFWASHSDLKPVRDELLLLAFDDTFWERANRPTRNHVIELISWIDPPVRQRLIDIGFDVRWQQSTHSGNTALHLAGLRGDKNTFDFLIDHGADIHMKNSFGKLPNFISRSR